MIPKPIHKILIANRGEIARRIMRTAMEMNITPVCIYTDNESDLLSVRESQESYSLGNGTISETFLNINKIIDIAKKSGADAIHPGYGFLSENFRFAEACSENNICFIGPPVEAIRIMGDKLISCSLAENLGIPVLAKFTGNAGQLVKKAHIFEYPVMIKATAGGGGKGMRIVSKIEELEEAIDISSREALNYFGDEKIYIEKFLPRARHIEIQILADQVGNMVHLFERDCSIQRRYQKIIEEAPAAGITDEIRSWLCSAAIKIAKTIGYQSAGTVEFLLDEKDHFYFLEMNTRIQVEHPVTEMITGLDIVKEQIRIAEGYPLSFSENSLQLTGNAIEARIYAEDPMNEYLPAPGRIQFYEEPRMKDIRIESASSSGTTISSDYDPLIAKVIAYGPSRMEAIEKLDMAIDNFVIAGVHNNLPLIKAIISNNTFRQGKIVTTFISLESDYFSKRLSAMKKAVNKVELLIAAIIPGNFKHLISSNLTVWENIGFWRIIPNIILIVDDIEMEVEYYKTGKDSLKIIYKNDIYHATNIRLSLHKIEYRMNESNHSFYFVPERDGLMEILFAGFHHSIKFKDRLNRIVPGEDDNQTDQKNGQIISPMHGRIVKINVTLGEVIHKGDTLMIIESMKLENRILSPGNIRVHKIQVKEGDQVQPGMILIHIEHEF